MLTQERLKEIVKYNPESGQFLWKKKPSIYASHIVIGTVAGWITGPKRRRYLKISINRKCYSLHRLAFLYMKGYIPDEVDHRDNNPTNNKWNNLREATKNENAHNCPVRKDNSSGYKGVTWDKKVKKWRARIALNGERINLGYFDSKEEAHLAYKDAAVKMHGNFACF